MNQDYLREEVRKLKKDFSIPFCYLSNKLNMNKNSFYNFMDKQKNLSSEKEQKLKQIIQRLKSNDL